MLVKYNSSGEVEWARSFGGPKNDAITSVSETSDGGFIVGGDFRSERINVGEYELINTSYYTTMYNSALIKYNSSGEVEWATSFGGQRDDTINTVAETQDGGFIVGGCFETELTIGNYTLNNCYDAFDDAMLIKFSSRGEVEWAQSIGGNHYEDIYCVAGTEDGGFIAGGFSSSETLTIGDYTLLNNNSSMKFGLTIKYNSSGEVEWVKKIDGIRRDNSLLGDRNICECCNPNFRWRICCRRNGWSL